MTSKQKDSGAANQSSAPQLDEGNTDPPFWEWVVAGIGAVALLACITYLARDAFFREPTKPAAQIQVQEIHPALDRHGVIVSVRNAGSEAASEVKIVAELKRAGAVVETADTVLAYLPGHSVKQATFYFGADPAGHEIAVRAESSQRP